MNLSKVRGRLITENEKQPLKEAQGVEKRATGEINHLARYQAIRNADLAREQAIPEASEATKLRKWYEAKC